MSYVSVSLTPSDPQPGNYSIYISSCISGSTEILIDSGLQNPNDFPYVFNSEDYLPNENCLKYRISDSLSDCEKTGQIDLSLPTQTPTKTPTPTPTKTPLPNNVFDVSINAKFSSGSTIAEYTIITSRKVPEDYTINFINKLYDKLGNTYDINVTVTVNKDTQIGTQNYIIPTLNYPDLRKDRYHIEILSSSIYEAKINRYGDFKFLSTDDDDNPQSVIPWRFEKCCSSGSYIVFNVPVSATQVGGWVYNGEVVVYGQECYKPISSALFPGLVVFPDSDYQSCQSSECQSFCDDYINVGLELKHCCIDSYIISNIVVSLPYIPNEGDSIYFESDGTYLAGCYRILSFWQSEDSTPYVVDEIFPQGCDECGDSYINCAAKTRRAINCCDNNNQISVLIDDSYPPITNSSLQQGFIWNGQCWIFTNQQGNWYESVTLISPNEYLNYPCNNDLCPECNTPTPTPTPTSTPNVPYPPEIKTIRIRSCCDNNIIIGDAIAEFLVPPVVGEFIYYTGGFTCGRTNQLLSGCYQLEEL